LENPDDRERLGRSARWEEEPYVVESRLDGTENTDVVGERGKGCGGVFIVLLVKGVRPAGMDGTGGGGLEAIPLRDFAVTV
jgi:hypothetical protein